LDKLKKHDAERVKQCMLTNGDRTHSNFEHKHLLGYSKSWQHDQ